MSISNIIKNIFSFLGLEVVKNRPWMRLENLLSFYKIETVIDVGANIGQFAQEILKTKPDVSLHCFEPISTVFDALKSNTAKFRNIHYVQAGLGDKEDLLEININDFSPSSSLLEITDAMNNNFSHATKIVNKEKIRVTTLDKYLIGKDLAKPILLKIDVQGYEGQVLQGAVKCLQEIDIIMIEATFQELYKTQILFGDLFNLLNSKGFVFVGITDMAYNDEHQAIFGNAIFKNKNK